jgi:hypothetical protein
MICMSAQTLQQLRAEAAEAADRAHPLHVIDTVILAVLVGIGWAVGRAWWLLAFGSVFAARGLAAYALAVQYGYRQGARKTLAPVPVTTTGPNPVLTSEDRFRSAPTCKPGASPPYISRLR